MESLATKYRPQTFDHVVGQETIITILQNQIKNSDTKQGYLFTGGAGTGKTTVARIFAKELDGEIIEIDAASNNGVDHIRELRENCKFKPISRPRKVYIIDEVHMLSTGAFNALLKTLEEPPSHAVFNLCTTDPQKIPATILSRVQRFDFKRMKVEQIVKRLFFILNQEGKEDVCDVNAIEYIAKLANGGMRDAISILDTCLGYVTAGKALTEQRVVEILGMSDYGFFLNVAGNICLGGTTKVLELLDEAYTNGKDLKQFVKGLLEFVVELRKLQALKADLKPESLYLVAVPSVYHERMDKVLSVAKDYNKDLSLIYERLRDLMYQIKYETNPRFIIEGELIALCL